MIRNIVTTSVVLAVAIVAGVLAPTALHAVQIGDRAPDFELPATTGGTIKLSQFLGKQAVLIEFYGADFAPV